MALSLAPTNRRFNPYGAQVGPIAPLSASPYNPAQAYPAAIQTQAKDYDDIMNRYRNIADTAPDNSNVNNLNSIMSQYSNLTGGPDLQYQEMTPEQQTYSQSGDVTSALANLKGLSETGGYSAEDVANIRERGISPIRSIYANASRNLNRQRALSGGYAPGYGAASAKMAREQSELIGGATTNVNAQLAEQIASGRRSIAPTYASTALAENARKGDIERSNIEAINRAREGNIARKLQVGESNRSHGLNTNLARLGGMSSTAQLLNQANQSNQANKLNAVSGMQSIYGTTPALANTFGNQTMQAQQIANQVPRKRTPRGGVSLPTRRLF